MVHLLELLDISCLHYLYELVAYVLRDGSTGLTEPLSMSKFDFVKEWSVSFHIWISLVAILDHLLVGYSVLHPLWLS